MQHRYLTTSVVLFSLLICSACTSSRESPLAPRLIPPAGESSSVAAVRDEGLPGLPDVSGAPDLPGRVGSLPPDATRILTGLGCVLDGSAKVLLTEVMGEDGRRDVMVSDHIGTRYRYWLRSFSGSGDTTGYLVQLNGCPVSTVGMRAYIARGAAAPQDVTASVLANSALPDAATMAAYAEAGVSDLFALTWKLDKVPVVRWVAEPDVDRPIALDGRTFDRGNMVHAGFLVWEKDRFTFHKSVPAALWPCKKWEALSCSEDPFLKGW
ncbi:hypothetical protein [Stenotrophomonas sp. ZAC14D2_NAIMI4_6]|uniref:hypothetical protein n=1 Tax=Stenotrophomonas sp. ZAC14D2_NAIMI4_6 TaxID=2072406 RepID=UPI000D53C565|nr:hypothetical protein [Stenotrophomonas sp. ZAC14D2_NAIMI4_6]AWH19827.1 hypothetical protein C1933_00470 [Stenotrophomonas sp. ZAC14D2_NAIMI4_6]